MTTLHCGDYRLTFESPLIMGIVNLTDDSFSGDGLGASMYAVLAHAERQRDAGVDMLDLGAESSRPGAQPISAEEEWTRLQPVLREVRDWGIPISIDTCKPAVMRAAIDAGAAMINDITALRAAGALEALAGSQAGICLMHMQGEPRTMQTAPHYADVVGEVYNFLAERLAVCATAGITRDRVCVDPGFGFGKTVAHNYALLQSLRRFTELGVPVLAGLSRKSMLGTVTGRENGVARLPASVAAAVLALERGATILRVHDVAATRDALAVWQALRIEQTE